MPETPETPATEDTLGWRLLLESQERFTEEDLQSIYQNIEDAAPRLEKYADAFAAAEKKYGLPAGLLHAVAAKESGGREDIISGKTASSAGAVGLMQFMPATAREYGLMTDEEDLRTDPLKSIDAAGRYFKDLQGYENVSKDPKAIAVMLAMYNWGPGNVRKYEANKAKLPDETAEYIRSITDTIGASVEEQQGFRLEDMLPPEGVESLLQNLFPDGVPQDSDSGILNTPGNKPPAPAAPPIGHDSDSGILNDGGAQLMTPKAPVQMDIYQTALAKRDREKKERKDFA